MAQRKHLLSVDTSQLKDKRKIGRLVDYGVKHYGRQSTTVLLKKEIRAPT